jgi:hypothetical protein
MDLETIFPEQSHPVTKSYSPSKAWPSLLKKVFPPTHYALLLLTDWKAMPIKQIPLQREHSRLTGCNQFLNHCK